MSTISDYGSKEQIVKITKIEQPCKYFNIFFMERGTISSATFKGLQNVDSVIEVISMLYVIKLLSFNIYKRPELIDEIKNKFSHDDFWEFNLEESH